MENETPAGWYSDPAGSGDFRYWDGAAWSEQPAVSRIPQQKRQPVASVGIVVGILIAVAPIIAAFVGSSGSQASMFDESSGSGAAIWLIFMTVPLGFAVAGISVMVSRYLQWRARSKYSQ